MYTCDLREDRLGSKLSESVAGVACPVCLLTNSSEPCHIQSPRQEAFASYSGRMLSRAV